MNWNARRERYLRAVAVAGRAQEAIEALRSLTRVVESGPRTPAGGPENYAIGLRAITLAAELGAMLRDVEARAAAIRPDGVGEVEIAAARRGTFARNDEAMDAAMMESHLAMKAAGLL